MKSTLMKYFKKKEIAEICDDKLWELEHEAISLRKALRDKKRLRAICSDNDLPIAELAVEIAEEELTRIEIEIKKWEFKKRALYSRKDKIKQWDLETIKALDFEMLIGKPKYSDGMRAWYLCPIHSEKTPSFCHYINENRWYCFGCHEYGTIIDLYMKIHDCGFTEAVKQLSKYV